MLNNTSLKIDPFTYKKKKTLQLKIAQKSKRKVIIYISISLILILMTSYVIAHNLYIYTNSKDLSFVVEYNFTSGFSSKNKLLRVQKMTLVYCDENTAIVEASGLSKTVPHKTTSIQGRFKKDSNKHWIFEKFV